MNAVGSVSEALDSEIVHLSFQNYSEMIAKLELYTNIGARGLDDTKEASSACKSISHGLWMFSKVYFLEQGFRDGFDGLVISLSGSIHYSARN